MKSHYTCSKCKKILPAIQDHFFPSSLKRVEKDPNRLAIPKCKICANQYSKQWRQSIKSKGLVRSQKNKISMANAVTGTIYIIGPDIPNTPYKIGITSGTDTNGRKRSLQTAHWMDLKLVWKSELLDRVDIIEKKLHKHFENYRVRGEWFNITKKEINKIPSLIKNFGDENER